MFAPSTQTPRSTRIRGLIQFLSSTVVFGLVLGRVYTRGAPPLFRLIGTAMPGALACAGLIEGITGVPFARFSEHWDRLKGWQRGLLGSAVLFAFAALVFLAMYLCLVP